MGVQEQTLQPRTIRTGGTRTAAQRPTLSVVQSGTTMYVSGSVSPDGRYVTAGVQASSANLVRLRKVAVGANTPVAAARDAIVSALPEANGVRLAAMMKDTWDRIESGDKSYEKAVDRLVAEASRLTPDSPVPPNVRASLAAEAEKFAALKTTVVESMHAGTGKDQGRIQAKGYVAAFPPDKLKTLLEKLRAGVPTTQP
jgi:hypothetical protein